MAVIRRKRKGNKNKSESGHPLNIKPKSSGMSFSTGEWSTPGTSKNKSKSNKHPKPPKRKKPKKQKNDGQGATNVQTNCMQGTCSSKTYKRREKSNRNNYGRN